MKDDVSLEILAEMADAHLSRLSLPGGVHNDLSRLTLLSDFCRLIVCAPSGGSSVHEQLETSVAHQVVESASEIGWLHLALGNNALLPDLLSLMQGTRKLASEAVDPSLRAQALQAANDGMEVLQLLLENAVLPREEWKAHSLLEVILRAGALEMRVAPRNWSALWVDSFVGQIPRIWQWPTQNVTAFRRVVWGLGSVGHTVRSQVPLECLNAMRQASADLLAHALRIGLADHAAHLLLARTVLGVKPNPLDMAAWRLLSGSTGRPSILQRDVPTPSSALAAQAVLVASRLCDSSADEFA